jgi:hypothetical protein
VWRPGGEEEGDGGAKGEDGTDDDVNWGEEMQSEYDPMKLWQQLEKYDLCNIFFGSSYILSSIERDSTRNTFVTPTPSP